MKSGFPAMQDIPLHILQAAVRPSRLQPFANIRKVDAGLILVIREQSDVQQLRARICLRPYLRVTFQVSQRLRLNTTARSTYS